MMNKNLKNDWNSVKEKIQNKTNEIRYSKEYLDMKDALKEAGKKSKKVITDDLKDASIMAGKIIKRLSKKERFRRLLPF